MQPPKTTSVIAIAAITAVFAGSGCLERKETVEVQKNGAVKMHLEYSGTEQDLQGPDAMPSSSQGWKITRTTRHERDQDTHVLDASAVFAPGQPLPETFGDAGDVYLMFPTEVRREVRDDGVYYHFHRRYEPRKFAITQYWKDRFIDDDIHKLADKDIQSLTQKERIKLLRAFAQVESHKQLEVIRMAVASALPDISDEAGLKARRALLDVYDRFDYDKLAESIKGMNSDESDKKLEQVGESVPKDARTAFTSTLKKQADLGDAEMKRLNTAIDREKIRQKVTETTRTQTFHIEVALPGEIVAHNGDKVKNGRIVWEFAGNAFCDRPFDLTAVSRLAPDKD